MQNKKASRNHSYDDSGSPFLLPDLMCVNPTSVIVLFVRFVSNDDKIL